MLPFDRHDWIVESNGRETRYIIDFYKGSAENAAREQIKKKGDGPKLPMPVIAMHLDVRPALDSPSALFLRIRMFFWKNFGINPFRTSNPKP